MRYVVLAVIETEDGEKSIVHAATCVDAADAEHLVSLIEDSAVIEVGDEWVNPLYREIAQEESDG